MVCQKCGYMMDAFDETCPRCARMAAERNGLAPPPTPASSPYSPVASAPPQRTGTVRPAWEQRGGGGEGFNHAAWAIPVAIVLALGIGGYLLHILSGGLGWGQANALAELEGQTVDWDAEIVAYRSRAVDPATGIEYADVSIKLTSGPLEGMVLDTQSPMEGFGPMGVGTRGHITGEVFVDGDPLGSEEVEFGIEPGIFIVDPG
ncbi:MAG: hypothetical protein GF320_14290 [Armatimonadia bacterium]|nr:hypothetical protein [Armatimonadia bacterium]